MGLGFYISAEVPKRGLLRRPVEPAGLFSEVETEMRSTLRGRPLLPFLQFRRSDAELEIDLYPGEEPAILTFEGERLTLSAKTSSAGPGYHAWLVDLVDAVSAKLKLEWQWSDPEGHTGDETGFHEDRDFAALQRENVAWLRGLARHLTSEDGEGMENISICLPMHFQVDGDYYAATPRGFRDRAFFESVAEADLDQPPAAAAAFFPWWSRGTETAEFYDGLADVLCWSVVPWRAPNDERDAELLGTTVDVLKRCSNPPAHEIAELEALLKPEPDFGAAPSPEGRGYLRRRMKQQFGGGWSVTLPGYYYNETEENGTEVYWFGGRTVRVSAYQIKGAPRDKVLGDSFEDKDGGNTLSFENRHLVGKGFLSHESEDGSEYEMLQAGVAMDERLAVVTICFEDPADRQWAIDTWKSVYRFPDRQQE